MPYVLDKYLSEVEGHLRSLPPSVRQGEIDEMASHLQQLHTEFISRGHTSEESEKLATARFGTARKAGLRLRDVWEENRGVWAILAAVLLSNYVLQPMNYAAALWLPFSMPMSSNRALMEPVTIFWNWWTLFLLPFGLNFVLGRWGGRRVVLAVPVVMLPLLLLQSSLPGYMMLVAGAKLSFSSFVLLLTLAALGGAWSGSALKHRGRFALVGQALLEEASARLLERQRWHKRRFLARASTCTLALALTSATAFAVMKAHVDAVLHPATPEAAVRLMLSYPYNGSFEMEPSTDVSVRLLPATHEHLKQDERLVFYTATMHASEWYRQKAITFLQEYRLRTQASPQAFYTAQECRDSLARLKPEGYTLSRVVRVRKMGQGWHIVEDTSDNSQKPWSWLYHVKYKEPSPTPQP